MNIKGVELEFIEDEHLYVADGIIVPSVSEILSARFGHKYDSVPKDVLARAAQRGTEIHAGIEAYVKSDGKDGRGIREVRDFRFLSKMYGFKPVKSEVPVILWKDGEPAAAGRLDLVLDYYGLCLADIKTTATLDKEYLAYQLNLYAMGYEQSYGEKVERIVGIHLRDGKRRVVDLPLDEQIAKEIWNEYEQSISDRKSHEGH